MLPTVFQGWIDCELVQSIYLYIYLHRLKWYIDFSTHFDPVCRSAASKQNFIHAYLMLIGELKNEIKVRFSGKTKYEALHSFGRVLAYESGILFLGFQQVSARHIVSIKCDRIALFSCWMQLQSKICRLVRFNWAIYVTHFAVCVLV